MSTFSQRYGYAEISDVIQRESLSQTLRTRLWNFLKVLVWNKWDSGVVGDREKVRAFFNWLWFEYLKRDLDKLPPFKADPLKPQFGGPLRSHWHGEEGYEVIKKHFFESEWNEALDFLEYVIADEDLVDSDTIPALNAAFEKENSAYRICGRQIIENTNEDEIRAIEEVLESDVENVREHIASAARLLSNRENPDFRNSIKESISAVEAECRRATGDKKATLGSALKKMGDLHPAVRDAFSKLYGYTSDSDGIRHAMMDKVDLTREEAKFMLIACSAFIGLLREKVT